MVGPNCLVCRGPLRDPKFLSCLHSFCNECLETSSECCAILCPRCHLETQLLPESDVSVFHNVWTKSSGTVDSTIGQQERTVPESNVWDQLLKKADDRRRELEDVIEQSAAVNEAFDRSYSQSKDTVEQNAGLLIRLVHEAKNSVLQRIESASMKCRKQFSNLDGSLRQMKGKLGRLLDNSGVIPRDHSFVNSQIKELDELILKARTTFREPTGFSIRPVDHSKAIDIVTQFIGSLSYESSFDRYWKEGGKTSLATIPSTSQPSVTTSRHNSESDSYSTALFSFSPQTFEVPDPEGAQGIAAIPSQSPLEVTVPEVKSFQRLDPNAAVFQPMDPKLRAEQLEEGAAVTTTSGRRGSRIARPTMYYWWKIGDYGTTVGQFTEPSGVAVTPRGEIVVADTNNHRVQVFDQAGYFRFTFGERGLMPGQLLYPSRVAVNSASGDFVIIERSPTRQVQIFNHAGKFITRFGSNVLKHPRGVCVDNRSRVIVLECKVKRVVIFDYVGNVLSRFTRFDHLEFPNSVCANNNDEIFVCDNRGHCVKVFSYDGTFLRTIGGEGLTNYPIAVSLSPRGEVVISDNHNNFNVTVFDQDGTLIKAYESKVKHAQGYDAALVGEDSVVFSSKDYRLYMYRFPPPNDESDAEFELS